MSSDPKVLGGRGVKSRGNPLPQQYPSNAPFTPGMPYCPVPGYQGPPHPWHPMHMHGGSQAPWPGPWNPAMGYPMHSPMPGAPAPPWARPQGIRGQTTNNASVPIDDNYTIDAIKRTYSSADGAIEIQRVKVHRSAKDSRKQLGYPVFDTGESQDMSLVPAGTFGALNERRPPPRKNRKKQLIQQPNQMPTGPPGPYQWNPYTGYMPLPYPYPYTGYAWPGASETENSTEDNERTDSLPLSLDSQRLDSGDPTRESLSPDRSFSRASSSQITELQSLTPSDSISVRGYKREHSMERAIMAPTPPPRTRSRVSEDFPSSDISKTEISKTQDWMIEMQKALAVAEAQRALADNMSDKTSSFTTAQSGRSSLITDLDKNSEIQGNVEDNKSTSDLSYSFGKFEKAVDVFRISLNSSPTNTETQTLKPSSESENTPNIHEFINNNVNLNEKPIVVKTSPNTCLTESDISQAAAIPNTCMALVPVRPARAKRRKSKENRKMNNDISFTSDNESVIVAKDKVDTIMEDIKIPEIKPTGIVEMKYVNDLSTDNKEEKELVDLDTSLDEVRESDIRGIIRLEEQNTDGRLSSASTDTFHSLKTCDMNYTDSTDILLPTSEAHTTADEGGNLTDSTAVLSGGDGPEEAEENYRWVLVQSGEAPELVEATTEGTDNDRKNAWRAQVSLWRARLIVSLCRGRGLDRQDWATFNLMVHHPLTLDLKLSLLHAPRLCQANSSMGAALVRVALIHLVTYGETLLQPEQARTHGWRSIRVDPSLPWAPVKGSVEILKALGYRQRDENLLRYPRRSGPEVSVLARITLDMLVLSEELRLYLTGNHKYPTNVSDLFFPAGSIDCISPSPDLGEENQKQRPGSSMSYDFVSAHSIPSLESIKKRDRLSSVTDDDTDTLQASIKIVDEDSRKDSIEISSEEEPTLKEELDTNKEILGSNQLATSNNKLEFSEKDRVKDPGKPPISPVPKRMIEDKRTSKSSLASSPLHFDRRESVATDISLPDLQSISSTPVSPDQRLSTPSPSNKSLTPVSTPVPNESENILPVTPVPPVDIEKPVEHQEEENISSITPQPSSIIEKKNLGLEEEENKTSLTSQLLSNFEDEMKTSVVENKQAITSQINEEENKHPTKENFSVTLLSSVDNSEQGISSKEEQDKKASCEPAVDHIYEEITEVRAKAAALKGTTEPVAIVPPPLPPKKKVTSGDEDDISLLSLSYPPSNCSSLQGSLRGGSTGARRKKRRAPMPPNWMSQEEMTTDSQSESPKAENKFNNIKKQESYDDTLNPFYEEISNSNNSDHKREDAIIPSEAQLAEPKNPFLEPPIAVGYIGKNPFYETVTIKTDADKNKRLIEHPYESIDKVREDIKNEIESLSPIDESLKDDMKDLDIQDESIPKRRSPRGPPPTAPPDPPLPPPLPPKMKNQLNSSKENILVKESVSSELKSDFTTEELNKKVSSISIDEIQEKEIHITKEKVDEKSFVTKDIGNSSEVTNISNENFSSHTIVSTSIEETIINENNSSTELERPKEADLSKHDNNEMNRDTENDTSMIKENLLSNVEVKKNTETLANGMTNTSVKLVDSVPIENAPTKSESDLIMNDRTPVFDNILDSESKSENFSKESISKVVGEEIDFIDDDNDDTMSQTSVGVLCFSLHEEEQSFPEQHNIALNDFSLSIMEDDIDDTLNETLPLSDLEKELIARVAERTASPPVPPDIPPKHNKKNDLHMENKIAPKASVEDMEEIPYIDVNCKISSKKEEGIPSEPKLPNNRTTDFLGTNVPFIDDWDEPPDCPPPLPPTSPPESDSETPKASPPETPNISPPETPHVSPPETPGNSPPETPHNSPPPSPTFDSTLDTHEQTAQDDHSLKEDILLKDSLKKRVLEPERSMSEDKYEIPDTSNSTSVMSQTKTIVSSNRRSDENLSNMSPEEYTAKSDSDKYEIPDVQRVEKTNLEDLVAKEERYEIPEVAKESFKIKVSQMPRRPPLPNDLPLKTRNLGDTSLVNPNKPPRRRNTDTPPTPSSPTPPPPPRPPKKIDSAAPPALPPKSTSLPMRPTSSASHFSTGSQTPLPSHSSSLQSSSSLFRSAAASSTSLFRSAASTPFGSVKSSASVKSSGSVKSGGSTPTTPPALRPTYKANGGKGRKSWPQVFCNCLYANTKNYDDIT